MNPVEAYKREKDGLDILNEIDQLALQHEGWETLDPADRERLKWLGIFFRKPTPGLFMMRIRMTNGRAASIQLRALSEIARRLGNGILDITTRQQIQIRAMNIKDVPDILRALEGVNLTSLQTGMDNVRNVISCPLSGLTPGEIFDASPIGRKFIDTILKNRAFTNLPRKLNVAITGCPENCTHGESQDISMTPAIREADGKPGFNIALGGKMGSGGMSIARQLDVFVEPRDAPLLAAEIVLLFRDEGFREERNKARLVFLLESWGINRFRAALEERWERPLEKAGIDMRVSHHTDHLGIQPQKQPGLYSVGLCVPTGRMTSEHMEEVARLAETYGSGDVRFTTSQNVILVNILEAKIDDLKNEPLLRQFSPEPHPFIAGLVTCTGTDYCNLGLIETKAIGLQLANLLAKKFPESTSVKMHWSGCPAGCGNHEAADIGFLGCKARVNGEIVDAVQIFAGGQTGPKSRPGEKIMELVPFDTLEDVLPIVLKHLNLLKKVRKESKKEQIVLMVPAIS